MDGSSNLLSYLFMKYQYVGLDCRPCQDNVVMYIKNLEMSSFNISSIWRPRKKDCLHPFDSLSFVYFRAQNLV